MVRRIEEIILELIPKLKDDQKWMPTSQVDSHYNCVAWVFGVKDKNIWPDTDDNSSEYFNNDGNICMWPPGLPGKATVDNFIKFFKMTGFEECDDISHEMGFRKIALYSVDGIIMTHVSVEGKNNMWLSKLGKSFDIIHSSPYFIEGDNYGKVVKIMKQIHL